MLNDVFRRLWRGLFLQADDGSRSGLRATGTSKKGTVVVGGGTGFVGKALCDELAKREYDVVVVSRTKGSGNVITWEDLERQGLPENTTAVVNLAGRNVLDPLKRWNDSFKKIVYTSRIDTSRSLNKAITRTEKGRRPKAYVQVTGVGFYPSGSQTVYDESSPGGEHDFLAKLVVDWEAAGKLPKEVVESDGTRNVWIRSGVVLGRSGGLIGNIFWTFYFGLGGRMGSGTQPVPWIHLKDLTGLIIHSVENTQVKGVLNGVAPQLINNQDFVTAFAKSLRRPAWLPVPEFVWTLIFGSDRASMIIDGPKVVPKRALEFGYKFKFPTIEEACNEIASAS